MSGRITTVQLKQLVVEESLEDIIRKLRDNALRTLLEGAESIWQVEVAMWRYRVRVARRILIRGTFTVGEGLALLLLKVAEVRDLVALLEGARLGVS